MENLDSQKDHSLPMQITFRGDELLLEEFCIDADQAMIYLGIKRSRLTQISGKELRVGRVRKDRYLRPVYRESDLKDYRDWTRATATHLSASKALEQAIGSLDDRFDDLLVVFGERLRQSEQHLGAGQLEMTQAIQRELELRQSQLGQGIASSQGKLFALLHAIDYALKQGLENWQQKELSVQQELKRQFEFLGLFHQDLRQLISKHEEGKKERQKLAMDEEQRLLIALQKQEDWQKQMLEHLAHLHQQQNEAQRQWQDLRADIDELKNSLRSQDQAKPEKKSSPRPSLRRWPWRGKRAVKSQDNI